MIRSLSSPALSLPVVRRSDSSLLEDLLPVETVEEELGPALPEPLQLRLPNGARVEGHLASDPRHPEYAGSMYPLRTYMLTEQREVAAISFADLFEELAVAPYPSQRYSVSDETLDNVIEQSSADRESRLQNLGRLQPGPRATPKDHSLNPGTITMYTGSLNEVSGVYAQQMADLGMVEGFHVRLATGDAFADDIEQDLKYAGVENVSVLGIPYGEVWVEDYGEPLLEQGWTVPAMFEGEWLDEAMKADRQRRLPGVDTSFSQQGQVHASQLQPAALSKAAAVGGQARQALSYLEGGNILTGTRANGEPYALIGRDSVALTRELLSRQSGEEISETKAFEVIAADLGLQPSQVFPVEQPGEFHVDMRMMPVAPGEIAINDARAAAEQQIAWLRAELEQELATGLAGEAELKQDFEQRCAALREEAEKRSVYEELSIRDLQAAGLKVHRLPGVFVDPDNPAEDTSNFFNARHGVNDQGERFSVFMGGTPREEAFVAEKLLKEIDSKISRLHFLDPTQTQETLSLWGGLKCRTKPDGQLVAEEWLQSPPLARLSA